MPKRKKDEIEVGDRVRITEHVREQLNIPDKIYIVRIIGRSYSTDLMSAMVKGVGKAIPLEELIKE